MFHGEICTYCICGDSGGHLDGRDGRASIGPLRRQMARYNNSSGCRTNQSLKFARGQEAGFAGPPSLVRAATLQPHGGRRGAVVRPGVARRGGWVRPAHYAGRQGRCDRRRRGDRLCERPHRRRMGGFAARAGHVLVLHRSEPDAGFLGLLPVTAHVWSGCHDAAANRHRAGRTAIGR